MPSISFKSYTGAKTTFKGNSAIVPKCFRHILPMQVICPTRQARHDATGFSPQAAASQRSSRRGAGGRAAADDLIWPAAVSRLAEPIAATPIIATTLYLWRIPIYL
jgi:hypothetical protein